MRGPESTLETRPWRTGAAEPARLRPLPTGLLLCLACVLVYSLNMREISAADTIPARLLPVALILEHRLTLDGFFRDYPVGAPLPYWAQYVDGHYLSSYPILPALLATPVYFVPVSFLGGASWTLINALAKASATLFAALSVVFVYLAVRQVDPGAPACGIALLYAFGTSTWSVSSQGLWGHGPAQLFLALALYGHPARRSGRPFPRSGRARSRANGGESPAHRHRGRCVDRLCAPPSSSARAHCRAVLSARSDPGSRVQHLGPSGHLKADTHGSTRPMARSMVSRVHGRARWAKVCWAFS